MADIIKIPHLNPLQFRPYPGGKFACEIIPAHEEKRVYLQKYQQGDTLKFQVLLLEGAWESVSYKVLDIYGNVAMESVGLADSVLYNNQYVVWGNNLQEPILGSIGYGVYCIEISITITQAMPLVYYRSEFFEYAETHEETLMIEYSHDGNENEMVFIPGGDIQLKRFYQLRVEGGMNSDGFSPSTKDTFYIDQSREVVLLNSIPFNVYKMTFGSGSGLPNWMADKLNRIFGLDYVEIGGKQYIKNDGAKLEPTREKGYPFAGWQIEFVEPGLQLSMSDGNANSVGDFNSDFNNDYF